MIQSMSLAVGVVMLALLWLGPLPSLAPHSFAAHMALHMGVVAVAAPLIAFGLASGAADPAEWWPRVFSAIPASLLELVVVWAWRGEWFDAYDAMLWLGAFAMIEMDVLQSFRPRAGV